jgi:formiminotetrahydrofolate cyclodeaminase
MEDDGMRKDTMDPEKIATRVMKGLVTMRGAAAKLHTASVDRQAHDVRAALSAIDQEYYALREYLNQIVSQSEKRPD